MLSAAWSPRNVLLGKCTVQAASPDPQRKATNGSKDKSSNLLRGHLSLEEIVLLEVFGLALPLGRVEDPRVGINDNLSSFVVSSGNQVPDEVAYHFGVR
jgi:hypothetical protein